MRVSIVSIGTADGIDFKEVYCKRKRRGVLVTMDFATILTSATCSYKVVKNRQGVNTVVVSVRDCFKVSFDPESFMENGLFETVLPVISEKRREAGDMGSVFIVFLDISGEILIEQ
jgi:hypothetical protein